jgi:methionyl-tRNA formyltransferase
MTKIALFSTSSRTIETAKVLKDNFKLDLIVTKTDKIVGRNKNPESNEIKKFAIENSIDFIEIEKFDLAKKEEVFEKMQEKEIELAVSFDFGFIIPEKLFNYPKYKFINIHFSLLPKHRGASAVQFAILGDEQEYGITYHYVSAKLDCGEILYQSVYPLNEGFNSAEAYEFLFKETSKEIVNVLKDIISEKLTPKQQNEDFSSITYSKTNPKHTFIFKEDAYSDLNEAERLLFRKIKAYNPWPILYTEIKNLSKLNQFKNLKLKKNVDENLIVKISDANFKNNHLEITELTPSGKKKTLIKEFINGFFEK